MRPERLPALAAASDAGIFAPRPDDAETSFGFGLTRILDGVTVLLTQ